MFHSITDKSRAMRCLPLGKVNLKPLITAAETVLCWESNLWDAAKKRTPGQHARVGTKPIQGLVF